MVSFQIMKKIEADNSETNMFFAVKIFIGNSFKDIYKEINTISMAPTIVVQKDLILQLNHL